MRGVPIRSSIEGVRESSAQRGGDAHPIPFQKLYDKTDDDANRLDSMELCKKS